MAAVFARSPASFSARTSGVLITSPDNLQHELGGYHVSTFPEVLVIQIQHTLEAFNIRGETSLQYGHPAPLLDYVTDHAVDSEEHRTARRHVVEHLVRVRGPEQRNIA